MFGDSFCDFLSVTGGEDGVDDIAIGFARFDALLRDFRRFRHPGAEGALCRVLGYVIGFLRV